MLSQKMTEAADRAAKLIGEKGCEVGLSYLAAQATYGVAWHAVDSDREECEPNDPQACGVRVYDCDGETIFTAYSEDEVQRGIDAALKMFDFLS